MPSLAPPASVPFFLPRSSSMTHLINNNKRTLERADCPPELAFKKPKLSPPAMSPRSPGTSTATKAAPVFWTAEEDASMLNAIAAHGARNWKVIAAAVPGRTHAQWLQRWVKAKRPGLKKGYWTKAEDDLLRSLVAQLQSTNNTSTPTSTSTSASTTSKTTTTTAMTTAKALKSSWTTATTTAKAHKSSWANIARQITGRTSKQCRERWFHHLDPSIRRSPYTEAEDSQIMAMVSEVGNKWAAIARALPGRTSEAVKTRWQTLSRRAGSKGRASSSSSSSTSTSSATSSSTNSTSGCYDAFMSGNASASSTTSATPAAATSPVVAALAPALAFKPTTHERTSVVVKTEEQQPAAQQPDSSPSKASTPAQLGADFAWLTDLVDEFVGDETAMNNGIGDLVADVDVDFEALFSDTAALLDDGAFAPMLVDSSILAC